MSVPTLVRQDGVFEKGGTWRVRLPSRTAARRVASSLAAALGMLVMLAFIFLAILPQTGWYATYTVLSDSMQPAIGMGSIVVVAPADSASLQPGDIISYTSAQPPYPTITHRIERISRGDDGKLTFKTKGDFNLVEDSWDVHYSNKAGLVVGTIPLAGYGIAALTTPLGRTLLGLLLAALVGVFWFRSIWTPPAHHVSIQSDSVRSGPVSPIRVALVVWLAIGLISGQLRRAL